MTESDTSSTRRDRPVWARRGMAIAGFTLFSVSLGAQFIVHAFRIAPNDDQAYWFHLLRLIIAFIAFALIMIFIHWSARRDFGRHHRRGEPGNVELDPTDEQIVDAGLELTERALREYESTELDKTTAFNFVHRLLEPASVRSRMVESITVSENSVRRTCAVEFEPLSDLEPESTTRTTPDLIPVLRMDRGQLVNDLDLRDIDSRQVQTYNHDAYMLLVAVCILKLLDAAIDPQLLQTDKLSKQRFVQLRRLMVGRTVIRDPLRPRETVESRADSFLEELMSQIVICEELEARLLCQLVALTQVTYAIVARVEASTSAPTRFLYSYREDLPQRPVKLASPRKKSWLLQDELRAPLGVDPVEVHVDASRAKKAASYHLEVEAPPGYYVAETWVYDRRTGRAAAKESLRGVYRLSTPYYRCKPPRGDSFAHLYTRGFLRSRIEQPFLYVRFAEKPPGSMGRAWLVSLALLALVWLFGVAASTQVAASPQGGSPETLGSIDPGALLVAVPLAFVAVVGFTSRERGYAGTLLSQLSLAGSVALITLVLILLQLFQGGRMLPGAWPSLVMVTHPAWIILLILATTHAAWTGTTLGVRYWRWRSLATQGNHERRGSK